MSGLIPLLLQPAAGDSRNSIIFPTRGSSLPPSPRAAFPARPPSQQHTHQQLSPSVASSNRQSASLPNSRAPSPNRHSAIFNKPLPPRPQSIVFQQKKKMLKRFSHLPPGTLLLVPTTNAEWKKTIAEVKRLHNARRYRLCSARCCEILENLKDSSTVEPAYLIYLHFYAASSLESAAHPLLTTSPLRVKLLEQSRSHYAEAAALIQAAEDSALAKSRSASPASSTSSRQHSPSASVSSRAGTPSTDVSSPGNLSQMFTPPGPPPAMAAPSPPVKKKVCFYMPVPEEPVVRPDSPTLGFEDFEAIENASRELPPLPPVAVRGGRLRHRPMALDVGHAARVGSVSSLASSPDTPSRVSCGEFGLNYRALGRVCAHLDGLRAQAAWHVAAVEAELRTCTHSSTFDPSMSRPGSAMSGFGLDGRPGSRGSVSSDGMPLEDLSERLERLRANGWRRARFDPRRYEVLRERVLDELGAVGKA